MKTLLAVTGSLAGYLVSATLSVLWFYTFTHHDPSLPASIAYMAVSSVYGVAISMLAGFTGAAIARGSERIAGQAVALLTLLVAIWSWWETPEHAHWSHVVAIVLMGPAAILGARILSHRRRQAANPAAA